MRTIDVVIPCYNYGRYLRDCVQSVLSQSDVTAKVLIIDDSSSDNSAEVGQELAASDNRVKFWRHAINKGHIATYNEGIEWVSADYMLILSADDYLLEDALDRAVSLMERHPEVGFVYGKAIETDDQVSQNVATVPEGKDYKILTGLDFIERSGSHNTVPTATAVIRTALQKRVGGYLPELPHSGDMEMWFRLAVQASVGVVDSFQAVYRRHRCNMSLSYYQTEGSLPDLQQRKAALDCFFQSCSQFVPNAELLRRRLFRGLSRDAIGLASSAFNEGETIVSERLMEFAIQLHPDIKKSFPWMRLACKRRIPDSTWRALQPAVADIRQIASSLRRLVSH